MHRIAYRAVCVIAASTVWLPGRMARAADATSADPVGPAEPAADIAALEAEDDVYEAVAEVEAPPRQATSRALDADTLTTVPGTSGDPLRALEVLPGVARSADGEPILRGAAQHESAVFIDGTSVPFLYHFGGVRSVLHPRLVERIEVYPGNFSARYGRATGGVVEATLRDPRGDALHAELELSLLDSSALVEGPVGSRLSFSGAARRSNIDLVFEQLVPDDTFDVVVAPVYWDYQAALLLRPSDEARVRLSFVGSRDQTSLLFSEPSAEDPALRGQVGGAIEFHRVQLAYSDRFGPLSQHVQAYVGAQSLSRDVGPNSEAYFDVFDFGGRAEWQLAVAAELTLIAGLDVEGSSFSGAYRGSPAPSAEGSLPVPDNVQDTITIDRTRFLLFSPAAYVEARYFPTSRLVLLGGLRYDYYHQIGAATVNPRFSQRWEVSDGLTLKSAVGWFSQPPEYYEALAGVGNPDIDPYHALHASAGSELRLGEAVELDVEGFFKHLTHRVVGTETGAEPHFVNAGRGRVLGLEVGARYHSDHVSAQLAYTLSRSERQDRDEPWRLFDRDQTHVLSAALGYDLGAGWRAGARFRYVTGNPTTTVIGSVYDAGADLYYPLFGAHNGARDPAFSQLDLRVDKSFDIGGGRLGLYLDVQNVYAAENPEGFTYSYDYREREPASGSPFFPNLGVRGEL